VLENLVHRIEHVIPFLSVLLFDFGFKAVGRFIMRSSAQGILNFVQRRDEIGVLKKTTGILHVLAKLLGGQPFPPKLDTVSTATNQTDYRQSRHHGQ